MKDTIQTRNRKSTGKSSKKSKSKKSNHLSLPPILSASVSLGNGTTPTGDGRRFVLPSPVSTSQYDTRFDVVGYAPAFSQPSSYPSLPPYLPSPSLHIAARDAEDMKPTKTFAFSFQSPATSTIAPDNKTPPTHRGVVHGNGVEVGGEGGIAGMTAINPSQYSAFSPFASDAASGLSPLHCSPHTSLNSAPSHHPMQPQVIM